MTGSLEGGRAPPLDAPAGEAVFVTFAGLAILAALGTITRRNRVAAAALVTGCFASVAVCHVLMGASFVALVQLMVVAGAVAALFVLAATELEAPRPRAQPRAPSRGWVGYAWRAGLLLFFAWVLLGTISRQFTTPGREIARDFGTAEAVGRALFGPYLFAYQAASVLVLGATVGAVGVVRLGRVRRCPQAPAGASSSSEAHEGGSP